MSDARHNIILGFDGRRLQSQMNKVQRSVGGVNDRLKNMAYSMGLAFGTQQILQFANEAVKLAGKMEGVERAYNKMADPMLMNKLKEATRGTVSELQLMQSITRAGTFGIDLQKMPELLKFARIRAKQLGADVDVLVDKITTGIGRKSVLILDDLGISTEQLTKAMNGTAVASASVGELTEAVGKIAQQSFEEMGDDILTTTERTKQLNAEFQNQKRILGEQLAPAHSNLTEAATLHMKALSKTIDLFKGYLSFKDIFVKLHTEGARAIFNEIDAMKEQEKQMEMVAKNKEFFFFWAKNEENLRSFTNAQLQQAIALKDYLGLQDKEIKNIKRIITNRQKAKAAAESENDSLERQKYLLIQIKNLQEEVRKNATNADARREEVRNMSNPDSWYNSATGEGHLNTSGLENVFAGNAELKEAEIAISKLLDKMGDMEGQINQNTGAFSQFGNTMQHALISQWEEGESFGESIKKYFTTLIKQMASALAVAIPLAAALQLITGGSGGLLSALNISGEGFGGILSSLGGNMGIPFMADGGIITKPTLAMIGEGNEDEAVIPLSKLNSMTSTNSINGNLTARFDGRDFVFALEEINENLNRTGRNG